MPEADVREIHKPFWIGLGLSILAWLILGAVAPRDAMPINDLFESASLAAFFTAVAFILVYTAAAFVGPRPRPKWWKNEVGTYLVILTLSRVFIIGPTAFAIMFNNGQINTWWWAWIWIGGHIMSAAMILALIWLWIRNTYWRDKAA